VGQDGRRHGVGAQVLVAGRLELVAEIDDPCPAPRDLERHVDRPLARLFHALAGTHRRQKTVEGLGVQLDQLLRAQAELFGFVVHLGRARPLGGADRHLLQQGGRRREHRGRGGAARGGRLAGRDLAQQVAEPGAGSGLGILRNPQSPPCVSS
jgi:hypothetical protein